MLLHPGKILRTQQLQCSECLGLLDIDSVNVVSSATRGDDKITAMVTMKGRCEPCDHVTANTHNVKLPL